MYGISKVPFISFHHRPLKNATLTPTLHLRNKISTTTILYGCQRSPVLPASPFAPEKGAQANMALTRKGKRLPSKKNRSQPSLLQLIYLHERKSNQIRPSEAKKSAFGHHDKYIFLSSPLFNNSRSLPPTSLFIRCQLLFHPPSNPPLIPQSLNPPCLRLSPHKHHHHLFDREFGYQFTKQLKTTWGLGRRRKAFRRQQGSKTGS